MKTNYLFTGLTLAAMLLASCEADDTAEIVINNTDNSTTTVNNGDTGGGEEPDPTGEEINLQGTKTSDLVLDPINTYTLTGGLIMAPGTKLTIPAGMTIKASSGASVFIAISQGATIDAQGTASEPIVLTSASAAPVAGDWGGLILLGKAPINSVSGNATSTSEIGGLPYGGTDPGDYSGIIKYLRIEYSGGAADSSSENNGFSFYGVGNNTVVDHIQAYEGKDDGMEFFGGTVNVNYIYVTGAQDDSVDWTEGFSGNNSDPVYFAKPTVSNIHIVGAGEGEAVRLRAGTQGVFSNMIIEDFALAYHIVGDATNSPTGQGVLDGDLSVTDVNFVNVTQHGAQVGLVTKFI